MLTLPPGLTEEEEALQKRFAKLRKKKKALLALKKQQSNTGPSSQGGIKRSMSDQPPVDTATATEQAKLLVKSGAISAIKAETKNSGFKRSRTLEGKLKDPEKGPAPTFQPFQRSVSADDDTPEVLGGQGGTVIEGGAGYPKQGSHCNLPYPCSHGDPRENHSMRGECHPPFIAPTPLFGVPIPLFCSLYLCTPPPPYLCSLSVFILLPSPPSFVSASERLREPEAGGGRGDPPERGERDRRLDWEQEPEPEERGGREREAAFRRSDSFPERPSPRKGNTLYVHGAELSPELLRSAFAPFGAIIDLSLDSPRNCAFVTYEKMESADQAMAELNGAVVQDVQLRVSIARKQPLLDAATGKSLWGSLAVKNSAKGSHRDKRAQVVYNEDLFGGQ
uniref:Negative elongation factor E n=1 Tax=Phasianus colchicus TaxID=9054 RepID=A0A669QFY6_PHACC